MPTCNATRMPKRSNYLDYGDWGNRKRSVGPEKANAELSCSVQAELGGHVMNRKELDHDMPGRQLPFVLCEYGGPFDYVA
jgi:hypothetical protein